MIFVSMPMSNLEQFCEKNDILSITAQLGA